MKIINPYLKNLQSVRCALLFSFSVLCTVAAYAQQGSQGNTTVFSGAEMTFFGSHDFLSGGSGTQPGIIGTVRTAPYGVVGFASSAGSYTGADDANHIDGYIRKYGAGSFIFPVGDNGAYGPFAASADGTTGAYFHADPSVAVTSDLGGGNYPVLPSGGPFPGSSLSAGLSAVSNIEYWDVDGTTATPLTLTWDAGSNIASLTGNNLSLLTIAGWDGSNWVTIPSVADGTSVLGGASTLSAGSITSSSAIVPNTYNVYTLAAVNSVTLPVTLTSFTAAREQKTVSLNWTTSGEFNSDRFEIEHSITSADWATIGTVAAKGQSSTTQHYSFIHTAPVNGENYYRLRMIDRDDKFSYSAVRVVSFVKEKNATLYPNPASEYIFIRTDDLRNIKTVSLFDLMGRKLPLSYSVSDNKIDVQNIPVGTYVVRIVYKNGSTENHKISVTN
jgi:hypothetical protein